MRIGVLGTGTVGRMLASALVAGGHEVRMGSRAAANEHALAWVGAAGERASEGMFADAAGFGELVVNATAGAASLDALAAAGAERLAGKVLLVAGTHTVFVCGDDGAATAVLNVEVRAAEPAS